MSGFDFLNLSKNLSRTIRVCADSSLKFSSPTSYVMNSVFGALMLAQLVSRIAKEPAATVLKVFSQCTAGAARSTRSLQN